MSCEKNSTGQIGSVREQGVYRAGFTTRRARPKDFRVWHDIVKLNSLQYAHLEIMIDSGDSETK